MSKAGGMKASYQAAFTLACGRMLQSDLGEVARRSGAGLNGRRLSLSFFGTRIEVHVPRAGQGAAGQGTAGQGAAGQLPPERELSFSPPDLPLVERILLLHYLLGQGPVPVDGAAPAAGRGAMLAFKNLPGASFYDPTYQKRGPGRIARQFGERAEEFRRACRSLGWHQAAFGDASFELDILPKIRALVVLHLGDEEFPPEANILFSEEVVRFLPLEDVAVLAGLIATRLARAV